MRILLSSAILLAAAVVAWSALFQGATPPPGPIDLVPAGAALTLQAGNLPGLLADWEKSPEKQRWLKSANYESFSRSRLFLRLTDVYREFTEATGFPTDMSLLQSVSGPDATLAMFDIGKLEMLFITRLPAATYSQSLLWQSRSKYQPRNAGGLPYFVRTDPTSHRTVGFAGASEFFLVATREDLLSSALLILSGKNTPSLRKEEWFNQGLKSAGPAGDVRLALNLELLLKNPYFRSYWIQDNASDYKPFRSAVIDLHLATGEVREERVLIRQDEDYAAPPGNSALSECLKYLPAEYGLYRAWRSPRMDDVLGTIRRKLFGDRAMIQTAAETAPEVSLNQGVTGTEENLETRIDEATPRGGGVNFDTAELTNVLSAAKVDAMVQAQSSFRDPSGLFVSVTSLIVLHAGSDWNSSALEHAFSSGAAGLWSTSGLGTRWIESNTGVRLFKRLDGLVPLSMAIRGRTLMLASSPDLLNAVLSKSAAVAPPAPPPDAIYAAEFRHARERAPFLRMMRMLDQVWIQQSPQTGSEEESGEAPEPQFFSQNIASLSNTLSRIASTSVIIRDQANKEFQTVVYRIGK